MEQGAVSNGNLAEFGHFEFQVCLNEAQGTLKWRHGKREGIKALCTAHLPCTKQGRIWSARVVWIWPQPAV